MDIKILVKNCRTPKGRRSLTKNHFMRYIINPLKNLGLDVSLFKFKKNEFCMETIIFGKTSISISFKGTDICFHIISNCQTEFDSLINLISYMIKFSGAHHRDLYICHNNRFSDLNENRVKIIDNLQKIQNKQELDIELIKAIFAKQSQELQKSRKEKYREARIALANGEKKAEFTERKKPQTKQLSLFDKIIGLFSRKK